MTRVWTLFWLGILAGFPLVRGVADEPAKKFLDKLRENEYFDVAVDYLDVMSDSPLASADFKARIPFEKAETLLSAASSTRDIILIQQHLDKADQHLKEFAQGNPDPKLLAESKRILARTLFGRGNLANIQAQSDKLTVDEKKELQNQAREFFNEALGVFENSLEAQKAILKDFKVDTADPSSVELRNALQQDFLETRFMSPAIKEQIADTYSDIEPERKKLLGQAAAEFSEIASKYSGYTRGTFARIAAGRCFKKTGKYDDALSMLVEILSNKDAPRSFKLDAAVQAIECWEKSKPPAYKEICGNVGSLNDVLDLRDVRDYNVAAVQLGYAKACHNYAEELSKSPKKDSFTKEIGELRRDAAKFAGNVARGPNPLRDAARKVIAEWDLKTADAPAPVDKPTNLAEAKSQAIAMLETVDQLRQEAQALTERLDATGSDRPALETELAQKREQLKTTAQQSLEVLNLAMQFVNKDVSQEDINSVRMRQAIAHFFLENYYEAAVIGEFLLDRRSSIAGSREASGVAMRAFLQLYLKAPAAERTFERTRLESICDRIIQKWPDEPGTDEAANILITMALQNADLAHARRLLDTMEAGSPARAKLETHMGRMVWNEYLAQSQKLDADATATKKLVDEAYQLLTSGVANLKLESLTVDGAFGALNLAQLYLDRGDLEKAIAQLETETIAPLDVIKQRLPPASDPKFVRETYRTALRAYVSGMRNDEQRNAFIDKAHNVVVALRETAAGDDPGQKDSLVTLYYQLARELLSQLDQIEQADEKAAFAQSLVTFMRSIQEQSSDAKILLWVGTTLNSVADKLLASGLQKNANDFQAQALSALDAADSTGFGNDPNAETLLMELKRQKAVAHCGQGQFDVAIKLFIEVLKIKPALLNVQVDAAKTLQLQGDEKNDPNFYAQAVSGTNKETLPGAARPTNVIWGWRQIAKATQGKEQFANAFFEAVYNMAYCRLRYGELAKRKDAIESAMTDIKNQFQLFPGMGGPQWKPKFDELLRRIQSSLGQPVTGLQ